MVKKLLRIFTLALLVLCLMSGMAWAEGEGIYLEQDSNSSSLEETKTSIESAMVTIEPVECEYTGLEIKPTVIVELGEKTLAVDEDYTLEYANNVSAGTATISITGTGGYEGSITATFTILPKNLSQAKVWVSKSSYVYKGKKITPSVKAKLDGTMLVKDADYTVSYTSNKNVGTAGFTISGIGNYLGEVSGTFIIAPLDISGAQIAFRAPTFEYTGDPIEPVMDLTLGETVLSSKVGFNASYENNVNAGKATVTVTGNGNYTGTTSTTFRIVKAMPWGTSSAAGNRLAAASVALAGTWVSGMERGPGSAKKPPVDGVRGDWSNYILVKSITRVPNWACCDCAVTAAVRWSGIDDDFIYGGYPSVDSIYRYLRDSNKWDRLGIVTVGMLADGTDGNSTIRLQPGDILVREKTELYNGYYKKKTGKASHVRIYVGRNAANARFPECKCTYYEADYKKCWPFLDSYHSKNGDRYVVFRRNAVDYHPASSKYAQQISLYERYIVASASYSVVKTGSVSKAKSFKINAKSAAGALALTSKSKYVKVNAKNKVTIRKNFTGVVKIKAASPKTANYRASKKTITVKVKPGKMSISSVKRASATAAKVSWKKMKGADKYQVSIAADKKTSADRETFKVSSSKKSYTFKKLKKGTTYYMQVRAYDSQTKSWGPWSRAKKVRLKVQTYLTAYSGSSSLW